MNEGASLRTRGGGHGGATYKNSEELGTKDDERKAGKLSSWTLFWRKGPKMRRRRLLLTILVLLLLWAFTYLRLPSPQWVSEAPSRPARAGFRGAGEMGRNRDELTIAPKIPLAPAGPPPAKKGQAKDGEFYYDGEIIFYKLPASLHAIARTFGHRQNNRNVLFAASDLKSAAVLIPMACDMATAAKNYVHMAIMGRSDLSLKEIMEINGVDQKECRMFWHDARPDYAEYSTEARAGAAISAALSHINTFMHPQVIITDDSNLEDAFFVRALKSRASEYSTPVIELSENGAEKLGWISRLDSAALAAWHKSTVDILIQAQPETSGSLMRLLTSLYTADYSGFLPPRLTIELPHEIDAMTQSFLSNFRWPPPTYAGTVGRFNQLAIHHRIPSQKLSAEEASIRFFESFYPANPLDSHMLLLSPRTQVSPLFFHYLKYHLLEYHYSGYNPLAINLIGFSLEIPPTFLNGTTAFEPPEGNLMTPANLKRAKPVSDDFRPSFLWQAPNCNAAVYFGSKWVEFHDFLSNRLRLFHSSNTPQVPKVVSSEYPSWTEYFLELMRARGYALLYPGRADSNTESLVTIHDELYQPPEEFLMPLNPTTDSSTPPPSDKNTETPQDAPSINTAEPFTAPTDSPSTPNSHPETTLASASRHLSELLPFLESPDVHALPLLSYDGTPLTHSRSFQDSELYADTFRTTLGGCTIARVNDRERKVRPGSTRDLFCWGDEWDWDLEEVIPSGRDAGLKGKGSFMAGMEGDKSAEGSGESGEGGGKEAEKTAKEEKTSEAVASRADDNAEKEAEVSDV